MSDDTCSQNQRSCVASSAMGFHTILFMALALSPLVSCANLFNDACRIATRVVSPLDVVASPPTVGSTMVPDFTAARDAAYVKARDAVSA